MATPADKVHAPHHVPPLSGKVPHLQQSLQIDTGATSPNPSSPLADGDYYANLSDLDRSDMRKFIMSPAPKGLGVIQCYVKRTNNGKSKKSTTYHMFLQDDHSFVLYGRKMPKNRTSNYRVSMRANDDSRDGPDFLGKLRAKNTWGTEFVVYDTGINPKDAESAKGKKVRREYCVVQYETNVLGSLGPRKMHVGIPLADGTGELKEFFFDELPARFKSDAHDAAQYGFMALINKPPAWNDSVGAHTLDFKGRVTMSSVKNFQLVEASNPEQVLVQFGRVEKEVFTLDFAHPFSPFQAFSVALSSFDSKLGCE
jgi:tubby-related protein 1